MATINTDSSSISALSIADIAESRGHFERPAMDRKAISSDHDQEPERADSNYETVLVEIRGALERANAGLEMRRRQIELSIDSETGKATVSVRDTQSGKILLQVPSEVSLRLAARIDQLTGVLVNETT